MERNQKQILKLVALLQIRNVDTLIRYVKSYSLNQNSEIQKSKIKYVSDKISHGSEIWGEIFIN